MKDSDAVIRSARESDAGQLLKIYAPYVRNTAITFEYEVPALEEFRGRIRNTLRSYPYLVAEADGHIAGYAYAGPFKERKAYDWACETTIYLREDMKGRGLGRILYAALEEALSQQGIINACACIGVPDGEPDQYLDFNSRDFHQYMGYRLVGEFRRCGYKFGRWYNMIWMEKHLSGHPDIPEPVTRRVTAAEMKQLERDAFERGMPYTEMMENAGKAAWNIIKKYRPDLKSLNIMAGKGNNGGDGYVIARLAASEGFRVNVIQADGQPVTDDAALNHKRLVEPAEAYPGPVSVISIDDTEILPEADVTVDALYGTGFHGQLRPAGIKACRLMNESRAFKVAVDIPSGVNADTGQAAQGAFKADLNVVFHLYKMLHGMKEAGDFCGEVVLADIGL